MKSVLVTGGAGYIGSHTCWQLEKKGYKVVIIDNLSTGYLESLPKSDNITFYKNSTLDLEQLSNLFKHHSFSVVLHFAAHINVEDSFSRPLNYYENNFVSLLNLLKMCQKYNVNNFVFSSTAAVYGDVRADKVDELHPTQPINPYGRSKLFAESLLQDFKNSNSEFEYVILRYFNVSGASDNGIIGQSTKGASNLIKIAVETAVGKRESLSIFGTDYSTIDGTCIRDFIHVDDLAEAHISSLDYLDSSARCSDVFNCGYGEGYSVREVVNSIKNISGIDFKVIECKRRIGDPQKVIADPSKIKNKLNWKPKKNDLELICKSAYLWEINKRY